MSRRTHLTIVEAGAALSIWPRAEGSGIDDWVVMVQQSDEPVADFALRVASRARRLAREGAGICAVDVLTAKPDRALVWRPVLAELTDEPAPRGGSPDGAEPPRSGIHEKPGLAKPKPKRLGKTAGAPS